MICPVGSLLEVSRHPRLAVRIWDNVEVFWRPYSAKQVQSLALAVRGRARTTASTDVASFWTTVDDCFSLFAKTAGIRDEDRGVWAYEKESRVWRELHIADPTSYLCHKIDTAFYRNFITPHSQRSSNMSNFCPFIRLRYGRVCTCGPIEHDPDRTRQRYFSRAAICADYFAKCLAKTLR